VIIVVGESSALGIRYSLLSCGVLGVPFERNNEQKEPRQKDVFILLELNDKYDSNSMGLVVKNMFDLCEKSL